MKQPTLDYMQRPKYDKLYTPVGSVFPLMRYLPKDKKIWECTDYGSSSITRVLRAYHFDTVSTDLDLGFDFLKDTPDFDFDIIITNPPYSLKNQFIARCYQFGKPFALLLPLTALEGVERGSLFREHGISVIVLDRRADFTGKGANWFNTSWFCWNIIPNNTLIFEYLEGNYEGNYANF